MTIKTTAFIGAFALLAACGSPADQAGKIDAVNDMASEPAATGYVAAVSLTPEGGYRMGNPNAPIKLVEYGSRTCPACKRFSDEAAVSLKEMYVSGGKVSFEFRDFLVHGAPDLAAALIGECAGADAFFPILEANYANQKKSLEGLNAINAEERASMGKMTIGQMLEMLATRAGYIDDAKKHGVSIEKARQCLIDQTVMDRLVKTTNGADTKMIPGTPTFFVNGKRVDGSSWPEVEKALQKAGA